MRRVLSTAILILFMLTSCAPAAAPNTTLAPVTYAAPPLTQAIAPTPNFSPSPSKTPLSLWKQSDVYTGWALREQSGISRESAPTSVPDSVLKMLPLIEFILDFRTYYDFYYDDLSYYEDFIVTNQHTLDNEAYLWAFMANLFKYYGENHPEVTLENRLITVPESAARDFLSLCFIDYTEQFALPDKMPERYKLTALPGCYDDPEQFMLHSSGAYILAQESNPPLFTGSRTQYVITRCTKQTDEVQGLDIVKLYGPDDYDIAIYRIELTRSTTDVFGLEWRISRIIRIDGADATESEHADK